jgi:hypothetical protein
LSAFRRSGRLMVTYATRPFFSKSTSSAISRLLRRGAASDPRRRLR